jgi:hypothetical protein
VKRRLVAVALALAAVVGAAAGAVTVSEPEQPTSVVAFGSSWT